LREKLKLNVASKKKVSLRKDTVENIYLSNSASTSDRKKISKNNITTQKTNIAKSPHCKRLSAFQNKVTSIVTKKSIGGIKRSNAIETMQSKASSPKVAGKLQKGKNFILENKLNIKKISSANKLQIGNDPDDIPQNVCNNDTIIQYYQI